LLSGEVLFKTGKGNMAIYLPYSFFDKRFERNEDKVLLTTLKLHLE